MRLETNSLDSQWMPFTANREFKAEPRLVVRAEGVRLWNQNGDEVLDGSSGLFCSPAGHCRPEIADAVSEQLRQNSYVSPFNLAHPGGFELAETVARLLPDPIDRVFFTNSGSESIDTALKIVMAYHRARGEGHRTRFVSRERAYHGVNIGGLSLSGMVRNREAFSAVMPNVAHLRHTWTGDELFVKGQPEHGADLADDLERICANFGGTIIAAVFVEPVAGSTGALMPPKGYLNRLREICDRHGILLVFDEVITGFGRMGAPFAAQLFGVTPDIVTMAKALTNGAVPMGAVAVRDDIYQTVTTSAPEGAIEFFHGYTYSAHPAATAAGVATQKIYREDGLFERAAETAPYFIEAMFTLADHPLVRDIRALGMMAGVEVHAGPDGAGKRGHALQKAMFWGGLHVKFTGDVGIVAPAFVMTRDEIDLLVERFRAALDAEDAA